MRAATNKLTDVSVKKAKPEEKSYKLSDGGGMYLEVMPTGAKYWRLKYRVDGVERRMALGVYPEVTLAEARRKRDDARRLINSGDDPIQTKRREKTKKEEQLHHTFEQVARQWHATQVPRWSESYGQKMLAGFEKHVFPSIGKLPLEEVTAKTLLAVFRPLQDAGIVDRANRLRQNCSEVFQFAIASDIATRDPAKDIVRAMQSHKQTHYAALDAAELPDFYNRLKTAEQALAPTTSLGLRLLALTFVRPGELRMAEWREFDFDRQEWIIPAQRMKMRQEHIVPLSRQVITVLKALQSHTGQHTLLFPSRSNITRPISDNTFRKALHDMGLMVTAHGFRATASTILNEKGFRHDVIERQLSHGDRDKIRAAYNRAQYLGERRELMDWWGNFLEAAEIGAAQDSSLLQKRA